MGGSVSTAPKEIADKKPTASIDDLLPFLYPIYYTTEALTDIEKDLVVRSWKLISTGQSAEFFRLKKEDPANTPCRTPMEFFGNRFYRRLLEVHPTCAQMFTKSTMKQGSLLLRMISFVVGEVENGDEAKFDRSLTGLATSHNKIGVKAVEYGIFGEVLFYALRVVLGKEVYSTSVHRAWLKVYSRMLRVILPVVVRYEVEQAVVVKQFTEKRMSGVLEDTDDTMSTRSGTHVLAADRERHSGDFSVASSTVVDRMMAVVAVQGV